MKINIIGTGKLGTSLGILFQQVNIQITGIFNRTAEKSLKSQNLIGAGIICNSLAQLPKADLTMISVGDDQIEAVAKKLYQETQLQPGHILFHCSGILSSDILKNPNFPEVYCASLHPLRSFASPTQKKSDFQGTYCAIEGDDPAKIIIKQIFKKLDAKLFELNTKQKNLYHAGCVFASNYLVTLADKAIDCFDDAGIDTTIAKEFLTHLMSGTIKNIQSHSCINEALTGPLQRGDINTLQVHLNELAPQEKRLYALLGLSTLNLCEHDPGKTEELIELLEKYT